ncbi:MAG: type II toxin-antitoxin system HicA family toxin [Saprospiraceae bacterium]|nr:type II toxin-antitoxin system HicA family toxin [Saprospiraceae bacterium]
MSKKEKLVAKLLNQNYALDFDELESILFVLGYEAQKSGKTVGSRRAYYHPDKEHIIRIHKPHPSNEIKRYLRNLIIQELKDKELL